MSVPATSDQGNMHETPISRGQVTSRTLMVNGGNMDTGENNSPSVVSRFHLALCILCSLCSTYLHSFSRPPPLLHSLSTLHAVPVQTRGERDSVRQQLPYAVLAVHNQWLVEPKINRKRLLSMFWPWRGLRGDCSMQQGGHTLQPVSRVSRSNSSNSSSSCSVFQTVGV